MQKIDFPVKISLLDNSITEIFSEYYSSEVGCLEPYILIWINEALPST